MFTIKSKTIIHGDAITAHLISDHHGKYDKELADLINNLDVNLVFCEGFSGELISSNDRYIPYLIGKRVIGIDSDELLREHYKFICNLTDNPSINDIMESIRLVDERSNYAVQLIAKLNPEEDFAVVFGAMHIDFMKNKLISYGYRVIVYEAKT